VTATLVVEALEVRHGPVRAVRGLSLEVSPGEIVGLIGANGAGKSTLTKVIAGSIRPDSGGFRFEGADVSFHHPRDALDAGIAMVPQELSLVEDRPVAENIYLNRTPSRLGFVRDRELGRIAREAMAGVGLEDVDPWTPAGSLTPVEQRLVTIAEAISKQPRLLILDEPSAALPAETAARLEPIIRRLAEGGTTIIYVSHRLGEIERLSDRVFAMRDGAYAGELRGPEIAIPAMVQLVGGKALAEEPPPKQETRDDTEVVIKARGLGGIRTHDVDIDVHAGEILGIGGLQGSGRSELLRLIGGIQKPTAGSIEVFGGEALPNPHAAVERGVGYVPEGRKAMVFPTLDVAANSSIAVLPQLSRFGTFVRVGEERRQAAKMAERLKLVGSLDAGISTLSGGNQQKACMARWLMKDARLLLLDEPTVGIDVHARAEIHGLLRELAAEGTTVVVACSEPEELVHLCHRVIVMVEGTPARELEAPLQVDTLVAASYAS
jgi:ribose transport system ATP-binding protein